MGFDLMASDPRIGDRSRRNDDKYLFLEALISARRYFYLSYCGHDRQDNTALPPSVLVSELIDYLVDGYPVTEENLVTRQRLQAFSPAYFNPEDRRLFSLQPPGPRCRVQPGHRTPAPRGDRMLSVRAFTRMGCQFSNHRTQNTDPGRGTSMPVFTGTASAGAIKRISFAGR